VTTISSLKTKTGQIYRFRVTGDLSDLPVAPGIYCFTFPQQFPSAPITPIYWGKAADDFRSEICNDPRLREAFDHGAIHVGTLVVKHRRAQKRILDDLIASFPPET